MRFLSTQSHDMPILSKIRTKSMKTLICAAFALAFLGCDARPPICIGGTYYMQFRDGLHPVLDLDGRPKKCASE